MEVRDVTAIVAATISLAAIIISLRNRAADIARQERYVIRGRVWEILNGEAGLRTVHALAEQDGKNDDRKRFLSRTATQLKVAGASELGHALDSLVKGACDEAARTGFIDLADRFMSPK
ncbi:MAG TPA: hypothetical protein VKQ32_27510 [Polyangia bacterium]|nr:hypothetical protein [Polyangia bacterium]